MPAWKRDSRVVPTCQGTTALSLYSDKSEALVLWFRADSFAPPCPLISKLRDTTQVVIITFVMLTIRNLAFFCSGVLFGPCGKSYFSPVEWKPTIALVPTGDVNRLVWIGEQLNRHVFGSERFETILHKTVVQFHAKNGAFGAEKKLFGKILAYAAAGMSSSTPTPHHLN